MLLKTNKNVSVGFSNPAHRYLQSEHFSVSYWKSQNAITGSSTGREVAWFIQSQQDEWVLRHYWRGGLMAKFSRDKYLFTGIQMTRPMLELALLEDMYQVGLPVPKPIAAKIERDGLFYHGDILIEKILNTKDLLAVLTEDSFTKEQWQQLGQVIARFHNFGIDHADLNIKNILFDGKQFYLIDFDQGKKRVPRRFWQQSNLSRLLRSFKKQQTKYPQLNFDENAWQQLISGYQASLRKHK